jgi:hypothetical protein
MTSSAGAWLPSQSIFLETSITPPVRPHRPLNQGDIFMDVPITVTGRTSGGEPKARMMIGAAMLIGHPCSLRGGARLATSQNVVQVRPIKDSEAGRFAEPWESDFKLFPLVGLVSDELWAADFNIAGTVHFKFLENRRIACLNLEGWAALQRRYVNHTLRIDQSIDLRKGDLRNYWNELDIWEEWCSRGHAEEDFEAWISRPIETDGQYKGTTRRVALELALDVIRSELPDLVEA